MKINIDRNYQPSSMWNANCLVLHGFIFIECTRSGTFMFIIYEIKATLVSNKLINEVHNILLIYINCCTHTGDRLSKNSPLLKKLRCVLNDTFSKRYPAILMSHFRNSPV